VAEMFSPPRVTAAAERIKHLQILPGFALDLRTCDEHGTPWNFDSAERRQAARQKLQAEKPMFLVGTPMCRRFCGWQRINDPKRDPEVVKREHTQALVHLGFMCEMYKAQEDAGRYFLHEHPESASSWREECIKDVENMDGVDTIVGDRCQYGQEHDGQPVKKATRWMSNSPEVLKRLGRRCGRRDGWCSRPQGGKHRHAEGAATEDTGVFAFKLCKAILHGFRSQLIADGRLVLGVVGIQKPEETMELYHLERICARAVNMVVELNEAAGDEKFVDTITGQRLRADLVRAARREEMEYFAAKNVWKKVPRSWAKEMQGKPPITVKWIDTNKGDDDNPNYRSRLVAREVRQAWESTIFAPTPPLESLRSILSLAATDLKGRKPHVRQGDSPQRTQISIIDIKRAYFNAVIDDETPTFVELPAEDPDRQRGLVGKLNVHMYGTRRAGEGGHDDYSGHLINEMGFVKGLASSCVFRHPDRDLVSSVYGDDFTTTGTKENLDWFLDSLKKKYELTESARLGPGASDDKEARILNRIVRWTAEGLEYEADPRQVEHLVEDLGLEGAKPLGTPGCKATAEQLLNDKPVAEDQQTPFRAVTARANYLAADRPECQFAAKEVCRWMSEPTEHSVAAVKRMGRYLEGRRRLVFRYPWQKADRIDAYSDTDWAGCTKTRKSTSGGCLMLGAHLIKSWSTTQGQVALSSGEAEYYGVTKAAGIALGFQSLMSDLGVPLALRAWTDSTATIGICARTGLGRLRHIDTQCLWLQGKVRSGALELRKVKGTENPADLFTKHLTSAPCVEALLGLFGCVYKDGRPATAPSLRKGAGTQAGASLNVAEIAYKNGKRADAEVCDIMNVDGEPSRRRCTTGSGYQRRGHMTRKRSHTCKPRRIACFHGQWRLQSRPTKIPLPEASWARAGQTWTSRRSQPYTSPRE
jgi:hypothetical protein